MDRKGRSFKKGFAENILAEIFYGDHGSFFKFKKEDEPLKIHISAKKDENNHEYFLLLPYLIIGTGIVLSTLIELFFKKSEYILPWFTIAIFSFTGLYSIYSMNENFVIFGGMMEAGGRPALFNFIFNIGAALTVLLSIDYLKKYGAYFGEYYILIQSSVLGMMIMASAKDLFSFNNSQRKQFLSINLIKNLSNAGIDCR